MQILEIINTFLGIIASIASILAVKNTIDIKSYYNTGTDKQNYNKQNAKTKNGDINQKNTNN